MARSNTLCLGMKRLMDKVSPSNRESEIKSSSSRKCKDDLAKKMNTKKRSRDVISIEGSDDDFIIMNNPSQKMYIGTFDLADNEKCLTLERKKAPVYLDVLKSYEASIKNRITDNIGIVREQVSNLLVTDKRQENSSWKSIKDPQRLQLVQHQRVDDEVQLISSSETFSNQNGAPDPRTIRHIQTPTTRVNNNQYVQQDIDLSNSPPNQNQVFKRLSRSCTTRDQTTVIGRESGEFVDEETEFVDEGRTHVWFCRKCTLENSGDVARCEACNTTKPRVSSASTNASTSSVGSDNRAHPDNRHRTQMQKQTSRNEDEEGEGESVNTDDTGQLPETQPHTWRCGFCTYDNASPHPEQRFVECELCGRERAQESGVRRSKRLLSTSRATSVDIVDEVDQGYGDGDTSVTSRKRDIGIGRDSTQGRGEERQYDPFVIDEGDADGDDDEGRGGVEVDAEEEEEWREEEEAPGLDDDMWVELQSQTLGLSNGGGGVGGRRAGEGGVSAARPKGLSGNRAHLVDAIDLTVDDDIDDDEEEENGCNRRRNRETHVRSAAAAAGGGADDDIEDFEDVSAGARLASTFPEPELAAHFTCVRDLKRTDECSVDFGKFMMDARATADLQYERRRQCREDKADKGRRGQGGGRSSSRTVAVSDERDGEDDLGAGARDEAKKRSGHWHRGGGGGARNGWPKRRRR